MELGVEKDSLGEVWGWRKIVWVEFGVEKDSSGGVWGVEREFGWNFW